ncbi:unnamed protein product, partial [Dovyalis caffra]
PPPLVRGLALISSISSRVLLRSEFLLLGSRGSVFLGCLVALPGFRAILVSVVYFGVEPLFGSVSDIMLANASLCWSRFLPAYSSPVVGLLASLGGLWLRFWLGYIGALVIGPVTMFFSSLVSWVWELCLCWLASVWAYLGRLGESASLRPPRCLSHIPSGLH